MVFIYYIFRLIGIGFGTISIVGCFFLKFIKEDMCCECGSKEVNPMETEHKIIALKGDHSSGGMARRYSSLVYNIINIFRDMTKIHFLLDILFINIDICIIIYKLYFLMKTNKRATMESEYD